MEKACHMAENRGKVITMVLWSEMAIAEISESCIAGSIVGEQKK